MASNAGPSSCRTINMFVRHESVDWSIMKSRYDDELSMQQSLNLEQNRIQRSTYLPTVFERSELPPSSKRLATRS